ncbi:MAG TPA: energy transducer TonB [Bacteroidales bacterium]|nr:energy transducer TonB [Bacteroidales bacterium]
MKTQINSGIKGKLKIILFFICQVLLLVSISSCGDIKKSEDLVSEKTAFPKVPTMIGSDTTWVEVDEMPIFPNGDSALLRYIADNVKYPEVAKKAGIQGRVIVRFCITSKGNVTSCGILKSVSPEIDAESLRVIQSLPDFEPGKVAGKPVSVWYMVPITFALK